jgi:hypothetical protein
MYDREKCDIINEMNELARRLMWTYSHLDACFESYIGGLHVVVALEVRNFTDETSAMAYMHQLS